MICVTLEITHPTDLSTEGLRVVAHSIEQALREGAIQAGVQSQAKTKSRCSADAGQPTAATLEARVVFPIDPESFFVTPLTITSPSAESRAEVVVAASA